LRYAHDARDFSFGRDFLFLDYFNYLFLKIKDGEFLKNKSYLRRPPALSKAATVPNTKNLLPAWFKAETAKLSETM
jgi:hypothetical protein